MSVTILGPLAEGGARLPLYSFKVPAGFPSPAADHIEQHDNQKIVATDEAFHDILYRASRNERLVGIIYNLREQFTRFRSVSINYPGRLKNTLEEHRQLVEAIAQRNPEAAQQKAREHIENAEQTLLLEMEQVRQSG